MSSTAPKPRTSDNTEGRRNLRTYFQTWSPREVILLAVACLGVIAAIGFSIAWGTNLVPFETVWGPVSSWVNVGVTALGFIIAGLTFYLRFREVSQNDDEKKSEKEKEDLNTTFELHQLTATEHQRMEDEASLVKLSLRANKYGPSGLTDLKYKYWVQPIITNETGKRLTDLHLSVPPIATHFGNYSEGSFPIKDTAEVEFSLGFLNIEFAGNPGSDQFAMPDPAGIMGAYEALGGKAVLSFRVAGGPRWNLVFDPAGQQRPTLKLN